MNDLIEVNTMQFMLYLVKRVPFTHGRKNSTFQLQEICINSVCDPLIFHRFRYIAAFLIECHHNSQKFTFRNRPDNQEWLREKQTAD